MTGDPRSIADLASRIRDGSISPVDLVTGCLAAIDQRRDDNAFITVMADQALADAGTADGEIRSGRYRGPLHGIPVAVKDLIDVQGTLTTSGSRVPVEKASADAAVVRLLRRAGAIILGKTNLHEFAFGTTSDETAFGPVRHPQDPQRSAGGSSGGSAAALATGMCFGAVGTDTGGSIRIPSAVCGTVGLKPTFGEISCDGVVPLSTSLDHVGPMARTVTDTALLFHAMKGTSPRPPVPASGSLAFGVPRQYFFDRLDEGARTAVERAIAAVRNAGHVVRDVTIPHASATPDVYLHIVLPEASWYHALWLRSFPDRYSPGIRLRLEMGRYLLAEDYVRAQQIRGVLTTAVNRTLEGIDALLLPALPIGAPLIAAPTVTIDGVEAPVRATMLSLTQLFNLTGHPAIVLPAGAGPDGLPRSVQLVGHRGRTERLLDIAAAVERPIG